MSNKISISNQALLKLGEGPITSFEDDTGPAIALSVIYPPTKESVLRMYKWNCAKRTISLAKLNETPVNSKWSYAFSAPDKNIRIHKIVDPLCPEKENTKWEVQGNKIYTNIDNAICEYTLNISEPEFDSHVEAVLVAKLVADLAYTITESSARETNAVELFDRILDEAKTTDALEMGHRKTTTNQLDLVRR